MNQPTVDGAQFHRGDQRVVFQGHFLKMIEAQVETPSGVVIKREYLDHPGAVTVVPVTSDGFAVVIWQYRAAMGREILEVCAGKRDKAGEDPLLTAKRELSEELGLEASELVELGVFYNSPGFCNEETSMYLALNLTEHLRSPEGPEEEAMRFGLIELASVDEMIRGGVLTDAKTILSLSATCRVLDQRGGLDYLSSLGGCSASDLGLLGDLTRLRA